MAAARWKNWDDAVMATISGARGRGGGHLALVQDRDAVLPGVAHTAHLRVLAARLDAPAVVVPPRQAEVAHHLVILLRLAAVGREVVADHRAVGAGEED